MAVFIQQWCIFLCRRLNLNTPVYEPKLPAQRPLPACGCGFAAWGYPQPGRGAKGALGVWRANRLLPEQRRDRTVQRNDGLLDAVCGDRRSERNRHRSMASIRRRRQYSTARRQYRDPVRRLQKRAVRFFVDAANQVLACGTMRMVGGGNEAQAQAVCPGSTP